MIARRFALALSATLGLGLASTAAAGDDPGLIVHEWGTFTSMQGSDGIALDGLHHEEEALPAFVYSRTHVRECPLRDRGYKGLEMPLAHVNNKMETPVVYFYSEKPLAEPLRVRLRVGFDGGLITQWYPVSDLLGPPEGPRDGGPLDMAGVKGSFLEWGVDLLPHRPQGYAVPHVEPGDPWAFARIPKDAYTVQTVPRAAPRVGPVETEKFLFYRGLGNVALPIRAETAAGARVTLRNDGKDPIRHVMVLNVRDGRANLAIRDEIPAGGAVDVACPLGPDAPPRDDVVGKLEHILAKYLVSEGLTAAEAEAMTRTWERSYFRSEGLRALYIVPRALTDRILPMEICPQPKQLVRVLVGRLECLTPEGEAEVASALAGRLAADAAVRKDAEARLGRLGRFLEPNVRRVLAMTTDEAVRKSAREVLARTQ